MEDINIRKYLSEIGKKGGSITSEKKKKTSQKNGSATKKRHYKKLENFFVNYPEYLEINKWKKNIAIIVNGGEKEYSPRYFCPSTGYFIEVATSLPNISAQKKKWKASIEAGHKLQVFWWQGEELTNKIMS